MNKITKAIVGSAITGILLVGTISCTTGEVSTSGSSTTAEEATVINGLAVRPGVFNDGKGDYRQTTIADNDPLMESLATTPDTNIPKIYTKSDILSAQNFVLQFAAEEVLDSTANGTGQAGFNAWWEDHKELFAPEQHQVFLDYVKEHADESAIVVNGSWREDEGREFMYGKDTTRIQNRILSVTSIFGGQTTDESKQDYIAVQLNFKTTSPMKVEGSEEPFQEEVSGDILYSVVKDGSDNWVIVGASTDIKHN